VSVEVKNKTLVRRFLDEVYRMSKNSDGQRPRPAYYYRALNSPTKGLLRYPTSPIVARGALGRCATSTPTP